MFRNKLRKPKRIPFRKKKSDQTPPPLLLLLPIEVFNHILSYLEPNDLIRFCFLVCSSLREVGYDHIKHKRLFGYRRVDKPIFLVEKLPLNPVDNIPISCFGKNLRLLLSAKAVVLTFMQEQNNLFFGFLEYTADNFHYILRFRFTEGKIKRVYVDYITTERAILHLKQVKEIRAHDFSVNAVCFENYLEKELKKLNLSSTVENIHAYFKARHEFALTRQNCQTPARWFHTFLLEAVKANNEAKQHLRMHSTFLDGAFYPFIETLVSLKR